VNKKHFSEMLGSLDEAAEIARGTRKPARAYTLSEPDVRAIRRSLGLRSIHGDRKVAKASESGGKRPGAQRFQALMRCLEVRVLAPGRRGR
jgi:hypothetical protein